MRQDSKNKITPSPKVKKYLDNVMGEADARRRYRWAINIFEKHRQQFYFDENLEYKLGLLYDHLAIFKTRKGRLLDNYLSSAEKIYRGILRNNPRYTLAWHGLSRVQLIRGNYKRALKYELKAHTLLRKQPKSKRGPLGVGNIFLQSGDYQNAEKWFKRELKELGENNLGANANLMKFYLEVKDYKKVLPYAIKTEKLLGRERKKDKNKTIELLRKQIGQAKKLSK